MNVSLTSRLEAFVREKVASGYYNNASEVVREALRLMARADQGLRSAEHDGSSVDTSLDTVIRKLEAIEPELRERGVETMSVFGSTARGMASADSDVDLLVGIGDEMSYSLVSQAALQNFVSEQLGRSVDIVTRDGLDDRIRENVLAEARPVF